MADFIIILVLLLAGGLALRSCLRKKDGKGCAGGCSGCSGNCNKRPKQP